MIRTYWWILNKWKNSVSWIYWKISIFIKKWPGYSIRPSKSPSYIRSLPVLFVSPGSRLMKVNLPITTNLSNLLVSLPLSPIFLAIHLLSCISSNFSYQKTQIEPSVRHCWFWIRFLFTSDWKFWWWNNFQNGVKKCTQRLVKLVWRNFFRRKVQWNAFKLKWKEVFWFVYV